MRNISHTGAVLDITIKYIIYIIVYLFILNISYPPPQSCSAVVVLNLTGRDWTATVTAKLVRGAAGRGPWVVSHGSCDDSTFIIHLSGESRGQGLSKRTWQSQSHLGVRKLQSADVRWALHPGLWQRFPWHDSFHTSVQHQPFLSHE